MDWVSIIQTLGFPIACVIACGFFIYKMVNRDKDEAKAREERYQKSIADNAVALARISETIEESNKINRELSETNRLLVDKMVYEVDDVKDQVVVINSNVEKILDKIEK